MQEWLSKSPHIGIPTQQQQMRGSRRLNFANFADQAADDLGGGATGTKNEQVYGMKEGKWGEGVHESLEGWVNTGTQRIR